jgi:hypothetical protein
MASKAPVSYQLYRGKYDLTYHPQYGRRTHVYTVNGEEVPSVTTVMGVIEKRWMAPWALKMMAGHLRSSLPSYNKRFESAMRSHLGDLRLQIKQAEGLTKSDVATMLAQTYGRLRRDCLMPESEFEVLLEDAKKAKDRVAYRAASVGTIVHEWASLYIEAEMLGRKPRKPPRDPQAEQGCLAFIEWVKEHKPKWVHTERRVYSPKHHYCGTNDIEAIMEGGIWTLDLKTSKQTDPQMGMQLAAYRNAREEETGKKFSGCGIIRIDKEPNPDGSVKVEYRIFNNYEEDLEAFLAALSLYRNIKRMEEDDRCYRDECKRREIQASSNRTSKTTKGR